MSEVKSSYYLRDRSVKHDSANWSVAGDDEEEDYTQDDSEITDRCRDELDLQRQQCRHCRWSKLVWCRRHSGYSLLSYEQIEEYARGNPYITSGYRPELPLDLCMKSLLSWNNETINIWSHLIGLIYFSWCLLYDNFVSLPRMHANRDDHIVVSFGIICSQTCMFCSAAYHLFFCLSERAHRMWFTMDLLGISISLMGMYLTGIYYSFYCFHELHNRYLGAFCLLAILTAVAPLHPSYTHPKYNSLRLALYTAIAAYGIVPSAHWLYLHLGSEHTQVIAWRFFPNIILTYGLSLVAFIIYALMIPERWLPGRLDILGHSHQWWHLLVLAVQFFWRRYGLEILHHRLITPCTIYQDYYAQRS